MNNNIDFALLIEIRRLNKAHGYLSAKQIKQYLSHLNEFNYKSERLIREKLLNLSHKYCSVRINYLNNSLLNYQFKIKKIIL
jgi:hypothetical protein